MSMRNRPYVELNEGQAEPQSVAAQPGNARETRRSPYSPPRIQKVALIAQAVNGYASGTRGDGIMTRLYTPL